ncbi:bifunctional diguanylate cyclase/phosphodiesterase [Motilimonas pumila]|uniref:EAL domain-containing protein n=1 Tax=Motilimonas pumila TaxID=2303987 RepID=A0A418YC48_9GAMM|nr:EAL domain-containing protein [Motilimonas pumila]RJG42046.1 EAL domain-containing protein [Motilimonas pumila]
MTLHKQLLIAILVLFAAMLAGVLSYELRSQQEALLSLQETDVRNASTSLGVSLTPLLQSGDKVTAEAVLKVVFDGGFYQTIELTFLQDRSRIKLQNPASFQNVPDWFLNLDLFPTVSHEVVLTSGWLQLAELNIVAHSGYAYSQLWHSLKGLTQIFCVTFIVAALILTWLLSALLKPLKQIRQRAEEIQKNRFGEPLAIPSTHELKQVVKAINNMTSNLAAQFKEQALDAERLREQVYQDNTSGLGNRSYFMAQAQAWIQDSGYGGVALLSVDILDDIYREQGFAARDELVKHCGNKLKAALLHKEDFALARISANEFAFLLPGVEQEQLLSFAADIQTHIADLVVSPMAFSPAISFMGLTQRTSNEGIAELLTQADNALQIARSKREDGVYLHQTKAEQSRGRMSWKHLVQRAIHQHKFVFKAQPALAKEGDKPYHSELFASIKDGDEQYFAGQFMPAVEQFKMGPMFDQYILQQAQAKLADNVVPTLAVNLTLSACLDMDFHGWLEKFLKQYPDMAQRLYFEIPETACVLHLEVLKNLVAIIHQAGFMFGVDQYGRHFQSLEYLELLHPTYVKVDHSYTNQVQKDQADSEFLASVCRAAHKLNIITIATRVEDQAQLELLSDLHIDGYQGFISPPEKI